MSEPKYTTAGAIEIKHMLPNKETKDKFNLYRPLDKDGVSGLVSTLVTHADKEAGDTINKLATLFFKEATDQGFSTPLSDYDNDSSEREALLAEFEHKVSEVLKSDKTDREKYDELNELAFNMGNKVKKQNLDYLVGRGSTAAVMAKTGARGNPTQLQIGTASPLMAIDVKGRPIPVAIKHSFAEGLSTAEHLAMSYGGRASTVMAQLSTALPGALFKKLTPNLMHEVITVQDCGTTNGINTALSDRKAILGRVEAGTNRLIDERHYKELQMSDKKMVRVRSPMTCEAHEGICAKCYGLAANGKFPNIGFNAGVVASQSASEVLTQAMLSTKHSGGVAGKKRNAYEAANNILNNPAENFLDEAGIATKDGTVTSIEKTPLGDTHVMIDGHPHFVARVQDPLVKVGDKVYAGDRLSTGTLNPRKLVSFKGIGAGRKYMAEELRNIYGPHLDPRHFELIAKNMVKYVQIADPGESDFLPGQKLNINDVAAYLKQDRIKTPLSQAVGKVLSRGVLELTPGTRLKQEHIEYLANHAIDHVDTSKSGIVISPIVPGLQTSKMLDKNWMSKMSFNRLQDVLKESSAQGASAPIHSSDPIASYVMGTEFGLGNNGKY